MVVVIRNDVLGDGVGGTVELDRVKLEGELLARLLLLVDDCGGVLHHGIAGKREVTRLEEERGRLLLLRLDPRLGVEVELLATGELIVVHAGLGLEHDALDVRTQPLLILGDVDVNRLALVSLVVEGALHDLGPTGGGMVSLD